jgi:coenzyme A diphosphatase NUDT7
MIEHLEGMGRLGEKVPGGPNLTDADLKSARSRAIKADSSKI